MLEDNNNLLLKATQHHLINQAINPVNLVMAINQDNKDNQDNSLDKDKEILDKLIKVVQVIHHNQTKMFLIDIKLKDQNNKI